jgi:hypothetical protein
MYKETELRGGGSLDVITPNNSCSKEDIMYSKTGYTHSDIGRMTSVRFMSHQVVEYKV